jgi:hypothetical protein
MLVESRKTWKNYTEKHTEEMELKQEKMKVEHGLSKKNGDCIGISWDIT